MSLPYYAFSKFLKSHFGFPVRKIVVDAGFTCPNRDGTKGIQGCVFCNNEAFSPALSRKNLSLRDQIQQGITRAHHKRDSPAHFIVYFQPFSNTYKPLEELRALYQIPLEFPEVVGIAIGTRPDCFDPGIFPLLEALSQETQLWIELGLESAHDRTLTSINRGHSLAEFIHTFKQLRRFPKILICVHLIQGLPGETKAMMLDTVKLLNRLHPDAVKFHQLEIVKDTPLALSYAKGEISLLSTAEYLDILGRSLALLREDIIIQRLFGFTPSDFLLAPRVEKNINYNQLALNYFHSQGIFQGQRANQEDSSCALLEKLSNIL